MKVLKFGGTSMGSAKNIKKVKAILEQQNQPFIAVVSALSGVTDMLGELGERAVENNYEPQLEKIKSRHVELINELFRPAFQTKIMLQLQRIFVEIENICLGLSVLQELSERVHSRLYSYGERMSSLILQHYLVQEGLSANWLNSAELIKANHGYLNAQVDLETSRMLIQNNIGVGNYIAPGFIASNKKNEVTLLGRGGSDYTAAIFASAIDKSELEIWSDVDGMLNANPKIVTEASSIEELSYKEAFELAYFGAKVLYPPTIRPLMDKHIDILLKNTTSPEAKGTIIKPVVEKSNSLVKGVASLSNISVVNISGVGLAGNLGNARKVFQAFEEAKINVILISQACSEHSICIGIDSKDAVRASKKLNEYFSEELKMKLINPIQVQNDHAIVALVGDRMRHHPGISGKLFNSLGENNINVVAVAQGASERNISLVVHAKDEAKAVNVVHERFFNNVQKRVHLFIAGLGNVGSQFLNVLDKQKDLVLQKHGIDLVIVGVANSKKHYFNQQGIAYKDVHKRLVKGTKHEIFREFLDKAVDLNLRNAVFIDNTASNEVQAHYNEFLSNSISVVTCNKIAFSEEQYHFNQLHQIAKNKNCKLKFETSVAAALPVLKTIEQMIISGDVIHKIEAVLSGSLNYIFNQYNGQKDFCDVVQMVVDDGCAEPNPIIDLTGLDVMRKILILTRVCGYELDKDQVDFAPFLPEGYEKLNTVDEVMDYLSTNENYFMSLYKKASDKGKQLKIIAKMEKGKAMVRLTEVDSKSPFFNLANKDNLVAIYSERYKDEPLVIKGAGAGPEITASGVFSDLMEVVNKS